MHAEGRRLQLAAHSPASVKLLMVQGFVALTRMCFMAKNKTLRAVLRLNHCVTMLAYGLAPPKQAQARLLRGADETGAEEVRSTRVRAPHGECQLGSHQRAWRVLRAACTRYHRRGAPCAWRGV